MKIEVTTADIESGTTYCASSCPIALACRRAGLVEADVSVGPGPTVRVAFGDWGSRTVLSLPHEAGRFASAFDREMIVNPFTFDLEIAP